MDESQIVDIWIVFKEALEKKSIETVAERYIDICADYGTTDEAFRSSLGTCDHLDAAIDYYLDEDSYEEYDEDEDYWEE